MNWRVIRISITKVVKQVMLSQGHEALPFTKTSNPGIRIYIPPVVLMPLLMDPHTLIRFPAHLLGAILFLVTTGLATASGQSRLAIEVSGGVGLPGFSEWSEPRLVGPAGSVGVSGDFSESLGWVVSIQYNQFAYRKERGETTNQFPSEPPGDVVVVTTSELEGGLYSMISGILGLRFETSQSRTSRSYLTFGLVLGSTRQHEATVQQTVAENGEVTGSGRVLWAQEKSDGALGVTARIGVARRFTDTLDWFAEFGYEAALTPDDSFPDNPDFLSAQIGVRVRI